MTSGPRCIALQIAFQCLSVNLDVFHHRRLRTGNGGRHFGLHLCHKLGARRRAPRSTVIIAQGYNFVVIIDVLYSKTSYP
jgi:hypothetical protein